MDQARDIAPHGYVSLREYVDVRFEAMTVAVEKAERASNDRFAGVNEFRAQLGDQTRTLVPRPEVEQKFKSIDEKLDTLATRLNARDDRGRGMDTIWAYLIGALGVIAVVVSLIFRVHS